MNSCNLSHLPILVKSTKQIDTKLNFHLVSSYRLFAQMQNVHGALTSRPPLQSLEQQKGIPKSRSLEQKSSIKIKPLLNQYKSETQETKFQRRYKTLNSESKELIEKNDMQFNFLDLKTKASILVNNKKKSQFAHRGIYDSRIRPNHLDQQGKMCITDLWSENLKREVYSKVNQNRHSQQEQQPLARTKSMIVHSGEIQNKIIQQRDSLAKNTAFQSAKCIEDDTTPKSYYVRSMRINRPSKFKKHSTIYDLLQSYQQPQISFDSDTQDLQMQQLQSHRKTEASFEPSALQRSMFYDDHNHGNKLRQIEDLCTNMIVENGRLKIALQDNQVALNKRLQRWMNRL